MPADETRPIRDKRRLDVLVTERGLAETRARAQSLIQGGTFSVDGITITKPATLVGAHATITLIKEPLPYVSRGGLKLRHGLTRFHVDPENTVAADIGASTGGFTDVLLKAGARRVYAIDVGYGQLAWTLRNDERVVVMERCNVRYLQTLPEMIDFAAVDVSFISLRLVLPVIKRLMRDEGQCIALIKPQFEAGRSQVGKNGVVRDHRVWREVLVRVLETARDNGWSALDLDRSPIYGPAGNLEFLVHLVNRPNAWGTHLDRSIDDVVVSPGDVPSASN